jgi:NAD+ kinase
VIRTPRRKIRRVAVVGRPHRLAVGKRLGDLEVWLDKKGLEVVLVHGDEDLPGLGWTPNPEDAEAARSCDLLITLGGDGTILAGARIVAGTTIPLLPVNLGGLGFLASYEGKDLETAVAAALRGELAVEKRSLLWARLLPHGGRRPQALGTALNDVVLKQPSTYRALRMDVWAGETFLGHVVADGMVVASPSGSTAYSLSAGGPVVAPGLEALVVTPVCPHTLGMRALVLPPQLELRVEIRSRDRTGALVSLDGLEGVPLGPRDSVTIGLGRQSVRFLRPPGHTLPVVLPHKLGWSGSPRRSSG